MLKWYSLLELVELWCFFVVKWCENSISLKENVIFWFGMRRIIDMSLFMFWHWNKCVWKVKFVEICECWEQNNKYENI